MDSQHHRNAAEEIVTRLIEAGLSVPFPSHQFGMVTREKLLELVRQQLRHYVMRLESIAPKGKQNV